MANQTGEKIVIAGGTGLVGTRVAQKLAEQGANVQVLSRAVRAPRAEGIQIHTWENLPALLDGATAVINLAGEGIADKRWSPTRKATLLESRLGPTQRLVEALATLAHRPPVLVNASAIGIYGTQGETPVDEQQAPGTGFLADLCQQWEAAADVAKTLGLRVVKLRTGVVLARAGGALPKIAQPVRLFVGAALGTGRQGFSWIHLEDLTNLILEAVQNPAYEGALNATAPQPCSNAELTRQMAKHLHRPVWPVPGFLTRAALKFLVGEMAEPMLLSGAFVLSRKAKALGFPFRFPEISGALKDLL